MKRFIKPTFKIFKTLRFKISRLKRFNFNAMVSVKRYQPGLDFLNKVIYSLGGKITPNYSKLNALYLRQLNKLYIHGGIPAVVKYLKVYTVVIQQVCAGHKLADLTPLGMRISRDKTGLPRIIPAYQRKLIRAGNALAIKYWLTLGSLYRDLHFSGVLKLGTITDPSKASPQSSSVKDLITPFATLYCKGNPIPLSELDMANLFPILKSGPQVNRSLSLDEHNTHPSSVRRSFYFFHNSWEGIQLKESLLAILTSLKARATLELWETCTMMKWDKVIPSHLKVNDFLGKLSTKEEAAGKVRVFAMVDPWTQWALRPLHKYLESILRRIPTDGTFNQLKPLTKVPWGKAPIFSFDLSAATDRLPMNLQVAIISELFGDDFAKHWSNLLVNRRYKTPVPGLSDSWKLPEGTPRFVQYSVGQPMGAYSSWTMLALTHHYIVHYCAWTTSVVPTGSPFLDYAILGDDVVIWNSPVADKYLSVMHDLGVDIGLAKSVISPEGKGLEFAKRTLIAGSDVSPIPFKEQVAARESTYAFKDFMDKYHLNPLAALRFLGYGYQVDPTKDNMVNHVLRIARLLPRTGKELRELFVYNERFLDLYPVTIPSHELFRLKVNTYVENLTSLHKRSTDLYWSLLQTWTSLCVDTSPIWGNPELKVQEAVWKQFVERSLKRLDFIRISCKRDLQDLSWTHNVVNSFSWSPIEHKFYKIPYRKDLYYSTFIVESEDFLSMIRVETIGKPVPVFNNTRGMEKSTTLKLWNLWSHKLNEIEGTKVFR